jgi:hypothetical protein
MNYYSAYSPKSAEITFCELRLDGVLRGSLPPLATPARERKAHLFVLAKNYAFARCARWEALSRVVASCDTTRPRRPSLARRQMVSDAASKLLSEGESGEGAHLLPGPRGGNRVRNVAMLVRVAALMTLLLASVTLAVEKQCINQPRYGTEGNDTLYERTGDGVSDAIYGRAATSSAPTPTLNTRTSSTAAVATTGSTPTTTAPPTPPRKTLWTPSTAVRDSTYASSTRARRSAGAART